MKEEGTSENLIPLLAQILKANTLFCGGYPEYPSLFVLLVLLQKSLKLSEKLFQHRFTIGRILRQNIYDFFPQISCQIDKIDTIPLQHNWHKLCQPH